MHSETVVRTWHDASHLFVNGSVIDVFRLARLLHFLLQSFAHVVQPFILQHKWKKLPDEIFSIANNRSYFTIASVDSK